MKNSNKTTVLTMVVSLLVAFVLIMSGPEGSIINSNYVYAAKSSGGGSSDGGGGGGGSGGGGSGSHSSKGGSDGGGKSGGGGSSDGGGSRSSTSDSGGSKGGSDGGGSSDKGSGGDSGKGSDNGDSGTTGSGGIRTFGTTDGGDNAGGGTTGSDGGGLRIGIPHNPNDDGFTNKDGPQPGFPQPPKNCFGFKCGDKGGGGDDHKNFFCRIHPRACDHGGGDGDNHHDNVKVIHRTVVVHDRDNNQQTIIVNANTAGTCFVTQTQIVNIPGLVAQLLDQCASVTIVPG
jgi:hypothetical protein